jgi:hypothetical protein
MELRSGALAGGCLGATGAVRTWSCTRTRLRDIGIEMNLVQGHPAAIDSAPRPADLEIPSTTMGAQRWLQGLSYRDSRRLRIMVLSVAPPALVAFAAANTEAAAGISAAGSVASEDMLGAAAAALGPIGATFSLPTLHRRRATSRRRALLARGFSLAVIASLDLSTEDDLALPMSSCTVRAKRTIPTPG